MPPETPRISALLNLLSIANVYREHISIAGHCAHISFAACCAAVSLAGAKKIDGVSLQGAPSIHSAESYEPGISRVLLTFTFGIIDSLFLGIRLVGSMELYGI